MIDKDTDIFTKGVKGEISQKQYDFLIWSSIKLVQAINTIIKPAY